MLALRMKICFWLSVILMIGWIFYAELMPAKWGESLPSLFWGVGSIISFFLSWYYVGGDEHVENEARAGD